jgi:hypothetical protein
MHLRAPPIRLVVCPRVAAIWVAPRCTPCRSLSAAIMPPAEVVPLRRALWRAPRRPHRLQVGPAGQTGAKVALQTLKVDGSARSVGGPPERRHEPLALEPDLDRAQGPPHRLPTLGQAALHLPLSPTLSACRSRRSPWRSGREGLRLARVFPGGPSPSGAVLRWRMSRRGVSTGTCQRTAQTRTHEPPGPCLRAFVEDLALARAFSDGLDVTVALRAATAGRARPNAP